MLSAVLKSRLLGDTWPVVGGFCSEVGVACREVCSCSQHCSGCGEVCISVDFVDIYRL